METKVLNYRIIIEPEVMKGKTVYTAYCPKLGVADWGKTVELARTHIQEAIECYIEGLQKLGDSVPQPDIEDFMVTTARVTVSSGLAIASA